jgi:hypothetical protein
MFDRGGIVMSIPTKLLQIIVLVSIISITAHAEFPFHETAEGDLKTGVHSVGWDFARAPHKSQLRDIYIPRWGYYPDAVLWQEVGLDSVNFFTDLFVNPNPRKILPDWDPKPTWSDVEPHMMILIQDATTGLSDTLNSADLSDSGSLTFPKLNSPGSARNAYVAGFHDANSFNLSMPHEERIYMVWAEIWESTGEPGSKLSAISSDTTYLVKAKITTSMDSLLWTRSMTENPDLNYMKEVLTTWPEDVSILHSLYLYYSTTNPECDSLEVYGWRFLDALESAEISVSATGYTREQQLERALDQICGE